MFSMFFVTLLFSLVGELFVLDSYFFIACFTFDQFCWLPVRLRLGSENPPSGGGPAPETTQGVP